MVRVHSIQPKALKASAFSLSYRVLWRLHRPLPVADEPPFGLHAALCANTFARLLLGESTHRAKSTQCECFFFAFRVLGRLHRPLPVVDEPPFGLHAALCANTICSLAVERVHSMGQKHSKRVLFLCLIVSLDDCIAHCLWQTNRATDRADKADKADNHRRQDRDEKHNIMALTYRCFIRKSKLH